MEIQAALKRLQDFNYPVRQEGDTLVVEETESRTLARQMFREEIYAVLKYEVPPANITQVDSWTIIISFEQGENNG